MDYACGHLSASFDIVIATHLLGCASCRTDLQIAERVATEVMLNDGKMASSLAADDILETRRNTPDMPPWRPSGALAGAPRSDGGGGQLSRLG